VLLKVQDINELFYALNMKMYSIFRWINTCIYFLQKAVAATLIDPALRQGYAAA
jgi:hypothetical protein